MTSVINPGNTAGNYIIPVNFGYVEEQITRSGAPNVSNRSTCDALSHAPLGPKPPVLRALEAQEDHLSSARRSLLRLPQFRGGPVD